MTEQQAGGKREGRRQRPPRCPRVACVPRLGRTLIRQLSHPLLVRTHRTDRRCNVNALEHPMRERRHYKDPHDPKGREKRMDEMVAYEKRPRRVEEMGVNKAPMKEER